MLREVKAKKLDARDGRFAIVASKYNARYVDSMMRAAKRVLARAGARDVVVVRVPGAFEVPAAAARLARAEPPGYSAIICLGVVLRGATTHAQHIGESVSLVLAQLQAQFGIPMIHEVLLLESEQQARERCLDPKRNRGGEAAQTAIEMAQVMRELARL
jgi:6,7-dimethyl-8-ribityllumazine synthase